MYLFYLFLLTICREEEQHISGTVEDDCQGMVIGDDNNNEIDVEIIDDEDGSYVDDVPVTVIARRRANEDDGDDNNHDDIVLPTTDNDGSTAVNVYLRAGWTLGAVIDRYIMDGGEERGRLNS